MKRSIEFEVEKTIQEVIAMAKRYFLNQGFKLCHESNERLAFSRGSILQNMITFNPLKWKSEIEIIVTDGKRTKVQSNFDINTSGQAVTVKEEKLWNSFIENFETAIKAGKDLTELNEAQLRETKQKAWVYIKWAAIGAVVTGIPLGLIAYWTEIESLASIGAASGAIVFMMNKINKDRRITGL